MNSFHHKSVLILTLKPLSMKEIVNKGKACIQKIPVEKLPDCDGRARKQI